MIVHQMQPTSTSCGPACVAMLVGVAVADVLAEFPKRFSAAKLKKLQRGQRITHNKTNVSEMWRLLKGYGRTMAPRAQDIGWAPDENPFGLLRVHQRMASGHYRSEWHWLVLADHKVHDPCASGPMSELQWFTDHNDDKIVFYGVEHAA